MGDTFYEPLPRGSIRLLKYEGSIDGNIAFSLSTHELGQAPPYYALSYTWGPPEDASRYKEEFRDEFCLDFRDEVQNIIVDGRSTEVRRNLYDFMTLLDADDRSHMFWIDALCINQNDKAEKAQQVQAMGHVYETAHTVLIWLGAAHSSTPRVIDMINRMITALEKGWNSNDEGLDESGEFWNPDFQRMLNVQDFDTDDWCALCIFCDRQWLSRTWTVQEAVLARETTIRCGPHGLDWRVLNGFMSFVNRSALNQSLQTLHSEMEDPAKSNRMRMPGTHFRFAMWRDQGPDIAFTEQMCNIVYNVPRVAARPAALLDLCIQEASKTDCSDLRDKVYGIIGLVQKMLDREEAVHLLELPVTYDEPVAALYTRVVTLLLTSTRTLATLGRCGRPQKSAVSDLPSWVPDYSQNRAFELIAGQQSFDSALGRNNPIEFFNASRECFVGFEIHGVELHVHGHHLSTVTHVGEDLEEMKRNRSLGKACYMLLNRNQGSAADLFADDLWKTMTCGFDHMFSRSYSEDELRSSFRSFLILLACQARSEIRGDTQTAEEAQNDDWQGRLAEKDPSGTICSPELARQNQNPGEEAEILKQSMLVQRIISANMYGRRLFLLENGTIGLGATDVKPGDVVSIISDGVRAPMILRKVGAGNDNKWNLIGEAYVRNIMYGEAVDQMEKEGKTWEELCIV